MARKKLNLPLDKKIIYSFCYRGYEPFLRDLPEELKGQALLLFVVPPNYQMVERGRIPPWMIIREEKVLSEEKFDHYLYASDVVILHKFQSLYLGVVSYRLSSPGSWMSYPRPRIVGLLQAPRK